MVTAFMLGLAAGSYWLWRRGEVSPRHARRWFLSVHFAICLYPLVLPLLFYIRPVSVIYMFLPAVAGVIGGIEFPLAVQLRRRGRGVGRSAGILYGLDLFGSCIGALLVGPILIPLLGLRGVCWWIAVLNAFILFILWTDRGWSGGSAVS